jgi:hypothetical protein
LYVGSRVLIGSIIRSSEFARMPTVALQTASPAGESLVTADSIRSSQTPGKGLPLLAGRGLRNVASNKQGMARVPSEASTSAWVGASLSQRGVTAASARLPPVSRCPPRFDSLLVLRGRDTEATARLSRLDVSDRQLAGSRKRSAKMHLRGPIGNPWGKQVTLPTPRGYRAECPQSGGQSGSRPATS